MTYSPPTSKNPTHSPGRPAIEPLNALQKVLPDGEAIFTKVQQGTKKGVKGYLEPKSLLTSAEAQERVQEGDNYGFRLGYETNNGWMLAVLDVEEQGVLPDTVAKWCNDRALVRWRSLHDGLNRLLRVTPETYDRLSEASAVDLDGDGKHEVELLAPERGHALAPGSTVEHRHCSGGKACDGTGTGGYRLVSVNPHAPEVEVAEVEDLLEMLDLDPDPKSAEGSDRFTASPSSAELSELGDEAKWSSLDASTRRRLERAEDFDKLGDQFEALKEGRYAEAGFDDDRSRAEFRLVEILGWLFDDDKTKVRRVMTAICRLNPQTNAGTRKWLERDGNYRDVTLNKACQHDSTYNPTTARSPKSRPEVSAITKSKVFEAVFDLRLASTQEIVDHEKVDRETTQVNEALKEYCEDGHIQWTRDGRETLYYIGAPFVPADKRDEYNL